jgi:acetyl esterase
MARISRRLLVWGWFTRRQVAVATLSEAEIIAVQSRKIPVNAVTRWLFGALPPGVEVTERTVPAADGEIPVRVYRPASPAPASPAPASPAPASPAPAGGRPLIVYFHGGGFVFGSVAMGDWICGTVADRVGAVVVSVGYRLAPGHRFPVAVEDCYAALTWAAGNSAELGAAGPVGVMGESAGGCLSAVMCLLARERGGPAIAHQVLIYPATDMTADRSAAKRDMPFLSAAEMAAYKRHYLGPDGDESHPWASPLLAADHAGLPPALIQVAEHDPLRPDGLRYAAALRKAGVPVRFTEYVGVPHGFVNFPGLSGAAHQAMNEVVAAQREGLIPATTAEPA